MVDNNIIIGYTTQEHLCLDLDQTSEYDIVRLVKLLQDNYPEIGDGLLVLSSFGTGKTILKGNGEGIVRDTIDRNSYHVVFTDRIPYSKSCDIIETLASLDVVDVEYLNIRQMRNDMTLRVSETHLIEGVKSAPMPMYFIRQREWIRKKGMCKYYMQLFTSVRRLFQSNLNAKTEPNNSTDSSNHTR